MGLGVPAQSAEDSEAVSTQRMLIASFIWQQQRAEEANKGRHVAVFLGRETIKSLFFMQIRGYFVLPPKPEYIEMKQINYLDKECVAVSVDNIWTHSNLNYRSAYLMTVRVFKLIFFFNFDVVLKILQSPDRSASCSFGTSPTFPSPFYLQRQR